MTTHFIKEWRESKGLTQEELAQWTTLPQEAISQIERGKRNATLRTLGQIANVLDLSYPNLFERPKVYRQPLDRFHIDIVARAIVSGKSSPQLRKTAKAIACLITQKLEAHDAAGTKWTNKVRWNTKKRALDTQKKYGH